MAAVVEVIRAKVAAYVVRFVTLSLPTLKAAPSIVEAEEDVNVEVEVEEKLVNSFWALMVLLFYLWIHH